MTKKDDATGTLHSVTLSEFAQKARKYNTWEFSALLWQKEATDKSPKSEKVMFLDWT